MCYTSDTGVKWARGWVLGIQFPATDECPATWELGIISIALHKYP